MIHHNICNLCILRSLTDNNPVASDIVAFLHLDIGCDASIALLCLSCNIGIFQGNNGCSGLINQRDFLSIDPQGASLIDCQSKLRILGSRRYHHLIIGNSVIQFVIEASASTHLSKPCAGLSNGDEISKVIGEIDCSVRSPDWHGSIILHPLFGQRSEIHQFSIRLPGSILHQHNTSRILVIAGKYIHTVISRIRHQTQIPKG